MDAFGYFDCSCCLSHQFVVNLSMYKINEINENSHSDGKSKPKRINALTFTFIIVFNSNSHLIISTTFIECM